MMNDLDSFGMKGSSKMPHSHSTPAGVDGGSRTPPATPRKAGKMLAVRVQMLDDSITMFQVQVKDISFSNNISTACDNYTKCEKILQRSLNNLTKFNILSLIKF